MKFPSHIVNFHVENATCNCFSVCFYYFRTAYALSPPNVISASWQHRPQYKFVCSHYLYIGDELITNILSVLTVNGLCLNVRCLITLFSQIIFMVKVPFRIMSMSLTLHVL